MSEVSCGKIFFFKWFQYMTKQKLEKTSSVHEVYSPFLDMHVTLKTKCLMRRIVGKYVEIIVRNILRISFILGGCVAVT
jgi:hypothetical protein